MQQKKNERSSEKLFHGTSRQPFSFRRQATKTTRRTNQQKSSYAAEKGKDSCLEKL